MRYSLTVTTPPADEPVSLAEAKVALRIDGTDEDAHLSDLLAAAREVVEAETGRATVLTTYKLLTDRFGCEMELPRTPAVGITSVKYFDYSGTLRTVDAGAYSFLPGDVMRPGRVLPAYQMYWPTSRSYRDDVEIVFTAGYADAASVPAALRRQIMLLAGYWFSRPETEGQSIKGFDQAYSALRNINAVPYLI